MIKRCVISIIYFYRWAVSPFLGMHCLYQPTCSGYAIQAIETYGLGKGCWIFLRRLARCHPIKILGGGCGHDPLPAPKNREDENSNPNVTPNYLPCIYTEEVLLQGLNLGAAGYAPLKVPPLKGLGLADS